MRKSPMYYLTKRFAMKPKRSNRNNMKGFRRLQLLALLMLAFISMSFTAQATTFTIDKSGKYTKEGIWSPHYPGQMIATSDTVVINKHVKLNTDMILEGVLIVNNNASLTGNSNIIVNENGSLINNGITIAKTFTNKGRIFNDLILEATKDLLNTGQFKNHESVVVGNKLDNTGLIAGKGGQFVANYKIINSLEGHIDGTIDICSGNFQNVQGGSIDSANITFCGNVLFQHLTLTAQLEQDTVNLKLINSDKKQFEEWRLEKSFNGENYEVVKQSDDTEAINDGGEFAMIDQLDAKEETNSVFYKMTLTDKYGIEKEVPVVQLNGVGKKRMSVQKEE